MSIFVGQLKHEKKQILKTKQMMIKCFKTNLKQKINIAI